MSILCVPVGKRLPIGGHLFCPRANKQPIKGHSRLETEEIENSRQLRQIAFSRLSQDRHLIFNAVWSDGFTFSPVVYSTYCVYWTYCVYLSANSSSLIIIITSSMSMCRNSNRKMYIVTQWQWNVSVDQVHERAREQKRALDWSWSPSPAQQQQSRSCSVQCNVEKMTRCMEQYKSLRFCLIKLLLLLCESDNASMSSVKGEAQLIYPTTGRVSRDRRRCGPTHILMLI